LESNRFDTAQIVGGIGGKGGGRGIDVSPFQRSGNGACGSNRIVAESKGRGIQGGCRVITFPGLGINALDPPKINPRILRVLVVPDLGLNLTCSSEFEIMNSTVDINNYGIKLLLMIPSVQTQINYLTSGTSSSHNRIKSADLANVLIPLPKKNTKLYDELFAKAKEYERRNKKFNELRLEMSGLKKEVFELVS